MAQNDILGHLGNMTECARYEKRHMKIPGFTSRQTEGGLIDAGDQNRAKHPCNYDKRKPALTQIGAGYMPTCLSDITGDQLPWVAIPAYQLLGQSYALAVFVAVCSDGWLLSSPSHQIRLGTHKPLILDNLGTTPDCHTYLGGIYFPMHTFDVGQSTFRA